MTAFDELLRHFERQLQAPWRPDVPPAGRVWILWYDKALERRIRCRLHELEEATWAAGRRWRHLDLARLFPEWMAAHEFFKDLLAMPDEIHGLLPDFAHAVTAQAQSALKECGPKDLMVLSGCGSLFGLMRISALTEAIAPQIPGRLLVLFPGHHSKGVYRLLDAREGWNYHAVPIPAADSL